MPQAAPLQFRVGFVIASASSTGALAANRLVDRLQVRPMALDIAVTLGAMFAAGALVYAVAHLVLDPADLSGRPLGPLSGSALVDLAVGAPVVLMLAVLFKAWLHVDMVLSFFLLYVPLAFLWLRRESARHRDRAPLRPGNSSGVI